MTPVQSALLGAPDMVVVNLDLQACMHLLHHGALSFICNLHWCPARIGGSPYLGIHASACLVLTVQHGGHQRTLVYSLSPYTLAMMATGIFWSPGGVGGEGQTRPSSVVLL
jgi:hypothetical protein